MLYFDILPDEINDIICSYLPKRWVNPYTKSEFRSKSIYYVTQFRTYSEAINANDLENVKWLYNIGCYIGSIDLDNVLENYNPIITAWILENINNKDYKKRFAIAAQNGELNKIKLLRKYGFIWDEETFMRAAEYGDLENMKWLYANGCPWHKATFTAATKSKNLENMLWLRDNRCPYHESCLNVMYKLIIKSMSEL